MTATRRRGAALEEAILDAGWEQLSEQGYAGFTFEAIADRAKTGKAALYRRWPDKESLLAAVFSHWRFTTADQVPETGSLREDTIALLCSANGIGDHIAALFSIVLGAHFDEIETNPGRLRARILGDRTLAMTQIVERAVERGELSKVPPQRIVTLPFDLFRHELIMNLQRVPDEVIVEIVDTVFSPLVAEWGRSAG